jgi:hypothetical protein
MNALQTSRGRRLLPLLAICSSLAGFAASARADALVSQLTDQVTPGLTALAGRVSAHVVYRSRQEQAATAAEATHRERSSFGALPALALILIFSPDTATLPPSPPSPPSPPAQAPFVQNVVVTTPSDGGTGHISGGPTPTVSTPEPASLILMLTGSATAGALALARRRRQAVAAI